jgi:hypothetical protein
MPHRRHVNHHAAGRRTFLRDSYAILHGGTTNVIRSTRNSFALVVAGETSLTRVTDEPGRARTLDDLVRDGVQLLGDSEKLYASGEGDRLLEWAQLTITMARAQGRPDVAEATQTVMDNLDQKHAVQAMAMTMERFSVDALRALGLLSQLSRDTDIQFAVVAQQVINRTIWGAPH